MKAPWRVLRRLGVAVLFTGALLALAFTIFRPLFRSSSADFLRSSRSPSWELKDPDGGLVKSSDFNGKVVILNFWATWCRPCKAEIPGFIDLQQQYREKGLVVVGIALDEHGVTKVKRFMEENRLNYPVVLGNIMMMENFGGQGIPTTLIIDRSGKIVAKHLGFTSKETLEAEIAPLL